MKHLSIANSEYFYRSDVLVDEFLDLSKHLGWICAVLFIDVKTRCYLRIRQRKLWMGSIQGCT